MALSVVTASTEVVDGLPARARPRIDSADVSVPEGFEGSVEVAGLSFPTGMGFGADGALYLLEGGSTWPTRPYLPARVLRLTPAGDLGQIAEETLGGPRGVSVHDGGLFISDKGGYASRIVRHDLATGERTVVVAELRGEIARGELKCSSGVWRCRPDGSGLELLAWGIRNPYGMAIAEDGALYVSDNDFEETGDRAFANDPDRIWRIHKADEPFGTVASPDWYGFPDISGDGLPAWHELHLPSRGTPAKPLIRNPPPWARPAAYLERPRSCMTKMDCCRSELFGQRGRLFACEWGTLAPMNSPDPGRPGQRLQGHRGRRFRWHGAGLRPERPARSRVDSRTGGHRAAG
jgi:hypothetical protein